MQLFDYLRKLWTPTEVTPTIKGIGNPNWQPVGSNFAPGFYDAFGSKPEPTKLELERAFTDTVYACATLIANKVATTPVKLFVRTARNEARPKCAIKPVDVKTLTRLRHTKAYSPDTKIDEVTDHAVLDVLKRVNAFHNYFELIGLTQLWLDLTGNAYWLVRADNFGLPREVYPITPHTIKPVRDKDGYIVGWTVGDGLDQKNYSLNEIIHFKYVNPLDPYGEGTGPARAAWSRIQIGFKEIGYLDSILTNQGQPDVTIAPKDPISPIEQERMAKEWNMRFRGAGAGGALVLDSSATVTPLNFPPRDLAELQLYQVIKTQTCNVFGVPPDVFELGESNRATAEASLFALAEHAIKPRMLHLLGKLNERFLPLFDQGQGRLFLEAESVVPDDKAFDLQRDTFLVNCGAVLRNEIREKYGYAPTEWAAEPLMPPGMLPQSAAIGPDDDQDGAESTNDVAKRPDYGPAIGTLQTAVYAGQLPREAAIAQAVILYGLSSEQAEELFPDVQPVKPADPAQPDPGPGPDLDSMKARKCGGEGGKPGPCPSGSADGPGTGSGTGGAATTEAHAKASKAVDALGEEIKHDPEANEVAKSTFAKVKDKLTEMAILETPAWAMEHCDVWLYEAAINAQHAGGVMAVKAAAFGAAKAYLGIRKLITGKSKATDDIAETIFKIMTVVGEAGGFNVPDLDTIKEQLKNGNPNGPDSDTGNSGGSDSSSSADSLDNAKAKVGEKKKCGPVPVPQVRQEAGWDCGTAATLAVLHLFGLGPATEAELVPLLGSDPDNGTSPAQISGYLSQQGLAVYPRNDLTIENLARATGQGCPVLCCIQDHGTPAGEAAEQSGHWVVVTGVEGPDVQFMDPSEPGPVAMTAEDFTSRWRDTDGTAEFIHFGIAVGSGDEYEPDPGPQPPKGKRLKAIRQPSLRSPGPFAERLQRFFRHQATAILAKLKEAPDLDVKALPLAGWFDLDAWTREMMEEMRPAVALYWDHGAKETVSRIGAALDLLKVVQPALNKGIDRATFLFCEETNKTTKQELGAAIAELRQGLTEGLQAGDVQNKLMRRVQAVFEEAENSRAYRIAHTEASRGQHAAQELTAKESGIVSGFRWILSSDACEKCLPLSGKVRFFDEPFTTLEGAGPYAEVWYPPYHPMCRCTIIEVVPGVND